MNLLIRTDSTSSWFHGQRRAWFTFFFFFQYEFTPFLVEGLIRKLFDLKDTDDISEEFMFLTDLETIENQLFGKLMEMGQENFVVRLYLKHNMVAFIFLSCFPSSTFLVPLNSSPKTNQQR